MHSFANSRTQRSRWGTNPWLNPRNERSRWGTNPWLTQRNERSRWGTNPWLNPRDERSRWGTNPWLRSWNIQRIQKNRWDTNTWLTHKRDPEQSIEEPILKKDEDNEEDEPKDRAKENESNGKRGHDYLFNPYYVLTYLKGQEPEKKRWRSNYRDSWGLKLNFPVLNEYQDRDKKMDNSILTLKNLADNEELVPESEEMETDNIETRSPYLESAFRFQVNPNSVLRQILEHFRILQRSRMTKRFVEPRIQPNMEVKGPGIGFWKSALQNNLSNMFDDKISVVRLKRNALFRSLFHKRNALFRSLFHTNEISKILKEQHKIQ